jgi:hypothetical protein
MSSISITRLLLLNGKLAFSKVLSSRSKRFPGINTQSDRSRIMRNRRASSCDPAPRIWDFAPRRMTVVQNLERCAAWGLCASFCAYVARLIVACPWRKKTNCWRAITRTPFDFFCKRRSRSFGGGRQVLWLRIVGVWLTSAPAGAVRSALGPGMAPMTRKKQMIGSQSQDASTVLALKRPSMALAAVGGARARHNQHQETDAKMHGARERAPQ